MSASASDLLADPGPEPIGPGPGLALPARSPLQLALRRFREDRVALGAAIFLAVLVAVAVASPLIRAIFGAPGPNVVNLGDLDVGSFGFASPAGPSGAHLLGTDDLGRDVFSRVLAGAGISLQVAFLATGLAVLVGVTLGVVAGYFRGWVDTVVSRLIDVVLAFPIILLALGLGVACSGNEGCLGGILRPGKWLIIAVLAATSWTFVARIVRGQTLSLREREFVEAARSLGASHGRLIVREILPNLLAPIIVYATLLVPINILAEAALSFLGVGVQPPQASWGQMIAEAIETFDSAPWYMLSPGVALLLTVLAFNLVGDGLRDALDPRTARA